jgi:outer membrane protein TolC
MERDFYRSYTSGTYFKSFGEQSGYRIALQSINSAEAYLKQSKAAYQPTLSIGPNYTFQTQSINTQFGQIIGERRYVNQFDITGSLGWEADIWGKLRAQEKAQLATYLGTVAAHKAVKAVWLLPLLQLIISY